MADQKQGARVVLEQFFEQFESLDVEVVGRLVEHQHVRRPREQTRQQQAVALATGQRTDLRACALRGKQEVTEIADHVFALIGDLHEIRPRRDHVDQCRLFIELTAELVEISHLHFRPELHLAGIGEQLTKNQAQQRRLAGAIRADDADLVTALHATGEIAYHHLLAKTLAGVLERRHQFAAAVTGIEHQLDLALALAPCQTFAAQSLEA
ncbi:MAG: hypothetical protein AW09_000265 [Candidatus Accumulibacter phosphatis]|uniref:Uncharacterized protein n=1 Tax=Candidatus Accumulibacter phosphatis TaxID=327160 RepID=A0A080MBA2_9PROT|nr:MAG: hypothetical protein AW09_000265 [Candidatus Accumulibacter phosphatis]